VCDNPATIVSLWREINYLKIPLFLPPLYYHLGMDTMIQMLKNIFNEAQTRAAAAVPAETLRKEHHVTPHDV
jgi:hypothetical protein